MEAMPTRWVQRPPEVDALLVTADSVDAACEWLAKNGRTAYLDTGTLRVQPGPDGTPLGFEVPFGSYLVHGRQFAPMAALEFEARFMRRDPSGSHSWKDQL